MVSDTITIICECRMRTPLAFDTECKAELNLWNDLTSPETIAEVIKWCRKAVTLDSISHPTITFTYGDSSPYGVSTSRVICQWGMRWDLVKWDYENTSRPIPRVTEGITPDARLFRKLYLECVGKMIGE